jgi:hypothetical protein
MVLGAKVLVAAMFRSSDHVFVMSESGINPLSESSQGKIIAISALYDLTCVTDCGWTVCATPGQLQAWRRQQRQKPAWTAARTAATAMTAWRQLLLEARAQARGRGGTSLRISDR